MEKRALVVTLATVMVLSAVLYGQPLRMQRKTGPQGTAPHRIPGAVAVPSKSQVMQRRRALLAKEEPKVQAFRAKVDRLKATVRDEIALRNAVEDEEYVYFNNKFGEVEKSEFRALKSFLTQNGGDLIDILARTTSVWSYGSLSDEEYISVRNKKIVAVSFFYEEHLESLASLRKLVSIQKVVLEYCSVGSMYDVCSLPNLRDLFLTGNSIQKIDGLSGCPNIENLLLGSNQIQKVEGLQGLANLRVLDLSNNQIQRLEGLGSATNLNRIYFNNNKLTSWSDISHLDMLFSMNPKKIEKIELSGNPINCADSSITQFISRHPEIQSDCPE
jgi:hypothetical protein